MMAVGKSEEETIEENANALLFTEIEKNAFLTYYNNLPKGYYVCYEQDAEYIADTYEKSRVGIKNWDLSKKSSSAKMSKVLGPAYLNLSQARAETIIRDLVLEKQLRLEIYSVGDDRRWFLYKKGSPGNHSQIEDLLYKKWEVEDSSIMMSVYLSRTGGTRSVGVAFCDVMCQKLGFCEFEDNEQFSNFESLVMQIGAKECFALPASESDADSSMLHQILEKSNVLVTPKKKTDFSNVSSIDQDLKNLVGECRYLTSFLDVQKGETVSAMNCLINGMGLLENQCDLGRYSLTRYNLSQYMRLDCAAFQALNLIPSFRDLNKSHNLYGLLNKCKTSMGSRKLLLWIKQPLVDIEKIQNRLDLVEIFVTDVQMLKEIRNQALRGISDIERICKKIYRRKVSLQDLVIIYGFVSKFPKIVSLLGEYCGELHAELLKTAFIQPISELNNTLMRYCNMVEEVIDLETLESDNEYQIKPSFDEVLLQIEEQKKQVKSLMKKSQLLAKSQLNNPDHFSLECDRVYGWVYRITKKEEKALDSKENKKRFFVLSSTKNAVKFQNQELKTLSDKWKTLVDVYEENCTEIIDRIIVVVQKFVPYFEKAQELVSDLDVFSTLAHVSISAVIPYTRPIMHPLGTGDIVLKNSRHVILEAQTDMSFIPNDIVLQRNDSRFIIITGPNMGGKSTFIRQTGLIVLMAQIGCFIPCDEGSQVSICDAILARVGASDCQLRGISTFMAEMLETSKILKTATDKSLIIIDELGRGTSTYDGFGLAWAISEFICEKIRAFCLFATHFHELTHLESIIPCVKNQHVSAIVSEEYGLVLQYKVANGPSNQSLGIHIAKIANFPKHVIEVATAKAEELERFEMQTDQILKDCKNDEDLKSIQFIDQILEQFMNLSIDTMTNEQISESLKVLYDQISNQTIV